MRDRLCALSPNEKTSNPARPGHSWPLDRRCSKVCPLMSHRPHDRLAAALIPPSGSDAVVWTTDIAQLPRDPALELLAWMAQALIAPRAGR